MKNKTPSELFVHSIKYIMTEDSKIEIGLLGAIYISEMLRDELLKENKRRGSLESLVKLDVANLRIENLESKLSRI